MLWGTLLRCVNPDHFLLQIHIKPFEIKNLSLSHPGLESNQYNQPQPLPTSSQQPFYPVRR